MLSAKRNRNETERNETHRNETDRNKTKKNRKETKGNIETKLNQTNLNNTKEMKYGVFFESKRLTCRSSKLKLYNMHGPCMLIVSWV